MTEGFHAPELSAPLRLEERVAALSPTATVKGMFFSDIVQDVHRRTGNAPARKRYVAFRDYPFREWIELLAEAAELAYPDARPLEGIRRLGQRAYPLFVSSRAGAVFAALAGRTIPGTLKQLPRALRVAQSLGSVEIREQSDRHALLELRELYDFPDTYYVGVIEGILAGFDTQGEVLVRDVTLCDADMLVRW